MRTPESRLISVYGCSGAARAIITATAHQQRLRVSPVSLVVAGNTGLNAQKMPITPSHCSGKTSLPEAVSCLTS